MINLIQSIRKLFHKRPMSEAIQAIEDASFAGQKRMTVWIVANEDNALKEIHRYIKKKHKPDCIFFFIYPAMEDHDNSNPAIRARWIKPKSQSAKSQRKWIDDDGYSKVDGIEYVPLPQYEMNKQLIGY